MTSYVKPVGWLPDLLNFYLMTILFWFHCKTLVISVHPDID
jgi:hypothetical protein